MSTHASSRHSNRVITGVILIIIGVLFLLDSFDQFNFGHFAARWWPLILILVGLLKLRSLDKTGGAIFFILGMVFLSITLDVINWGSIIRFWPVILILIGISIIFKSRRRHDVLRSQKYETHDDFISSNAVFAGTRRVVKSRNFKGGDILALFGGVELDLRHAGISPNGCELHVTALFGGIDFFVPKEADVVVYGTPIFGGIDDTTEAVSSTEEAKKIILKCTVAFGGVDISN